ncbi:hypothetical protein KPL47_24440, partial [Clostridium estertheticum]|nr:hypothetical protein [Clostridium estertheticum]
AGHDTDYFYYEIETREKYEVGANISFKNKDFYVNQYKAQALSDEVIYKYRLCRKNGVWQIKVINSLIGGASIEGKVLEVKGEKIKLHLNIDKSQDKDKASWFPYAPPTGNVMYSMPIVGTSASLYFPSETSEEPIVTGCVRTNGSSCAKTADTTKRYFGTEHGSEIEMVPGALNIKGGSKEPLSISFDDAVGVTIKSHKKLSLNADGGIIMKTPQSVKLKAQSQILVAKAGTKSGFSMETDLHFLSNNVIKNGSDREAFAAFDDEPTVGKKPEPKPVKKAVVAKPPAEKKKGFNWGKLAGNVLAGLAVVAVVAIAAVAIAVTFGAATAVVAAIAIGAAVAGTAAVASQAISDVQSGEVSDITAYMKAGGREALVGALSGAILGPFGMGEALGAKMIIGGLTNGVESLVRQTLEGKGINFKTLLLDAGIGAATAGVFHGAGKLFQKTSPFVKKAFNKIASNISENTRIAKIALSNMEKGPKSVVLGSNLGNVDEALGRFTKEFKKVKSGVVSNSKNLRSSPSTYYSYDELFKMTREAELTGKSIGFESHHLLEKQFSNKFGINQGDIISVPLTPKWHRGVNSSKIIGEGKNINNAIEREIKKITGTNTQRAAIKNATPEQIWQAHRNVYEGMGQKDWAEAIYSAYVKNLKIPYN